MMKRTVLTLAAVTAIAAPALIAPALFTPANAQASLNIGLSVPGPVPVYPAPSYGYVSGGYPAYAWGEGYRHWDGGWNRGWEHREWREHHDWDRGRHWDHRGGDRDHHWR